MIRDDQRCRALTDWWLVSGGKSKRRTRQRLQQPPYTVSDIPWMWGGGGDSDDRREGDSTNVTRSAAAGLPARVPHSRPSHHSALLSPSLQMVLPSRDTQASHVSETDASHAGPGTVHRMGSDVS